MKSLILFLFVVGIILITTTQQKKALEHIKTEKIIEYRFIPRSIYDEQLDSTQLTQSFENMFQKQDVFMTSPYR